MTNWNHRHVIDLATFCLEDYISVIELTHRFKTLPLKGSRKIPALQGRLVATLFFEPSTRTRSSFELAAKNLSADVQSFTPSTSSMSKGESPLDTALTYVAMGADVLVIRHSSTNIPQQIANALDKDGIKTSVINGGDGLHSHPSQGLLDLFTLINHFDPINRLPNSLFRKKIVIVGDILHSRVARSNLWALTACGANIVLCGPASLVPQDFEDFINSPPPGQKNDPINKRGTIKVERCLEKALSNADGIMTLRLQKERMRQYLLTDLDSYHIEYGLTHEKLELCGRPVPVLHPGPVNRGIEMSSALLEDRSICLVEEQIRNGVYTRMALLYLINTLEKE